MLSPINLDEYLDPELYDLENPGFEPAGPFYLALAQQIGGAVLELGCGTGRYTIPMAERGIDIAGLDLVPEMLESAKSKAGSASVAWIQADARSFQLGRKFELIFESGAMFQHLLERSDQEQMLACVLEHVTDNVRFVVTLPIHTEDWMVTVEEEQPWFSYTTPAGIEIKVSGTQHYDSVRQVKLETAYRRWRDSDSNEIVKIAPLSLRQTLPDEMKRLLHETGFALTQCYGDWQQTPFSSESTLMICVCQKTME